jgi:ferric-dicitrate binding protein FerR (iron transport regulator)
MNDFYIELLRKYLINQTSEVESRIVEKWLRENNLSKEDVDYALNDPERIWIFDEIKPNEYWAGIQKSITTHKRSARIAFLWKVAASIAVIIALSGVAFIYNNYQNRPQIVFNNSSQVIKYILPDSSIVSLNAHSKLTFNNNFLRKRQVTFDGQAFFKVKRNPDKPFVIKTSLSDIKVLGTSFCVSTNGKDAEVIVLTGKVAFYSSQLHSDTVYLEKGEKGLFIAQTGRLEEQINYDQNFLSWENHKLTFDKSPLADVIRDLERFYKVKFIIKSKDIYQLNLTSEFSDTSLNDVLKEIELVLNIKSEINGNTITLTLK